MNKEQPAEFYASSRKEWRKWLKENGEKTDRIWLLIYKKESGVPSLTYAEAVEEALCFGWIDSKPNKRDAQSYVQLFARRNPKSGWSRLNKQRVEKLVKQKLMTRRGMSVIEIAKKNGAWTALDEVSDMIIPPDLRKALAGNRKAQAYFEAFPPSVKKGILDWIRSAKKEETRKKRIEETVRLAAENVRANQYRKADS